MAGEGGATLLADKVFATDSRWLGPLGFRILLGRG